MVRKEKDHLVVNYYYAANDSYILRGARKGMITHLTGTNRFFSRTTAPRDVGLASARVRRFPAIPRAGAWWGPRDGAAVENDLPRREGTWEVVKATDDGRPVPQEKVKGARFVFRKDVLTIVGVHGEETGRGHIGRAHHRSPGQ